MANSHLRRNTTTQLNCRDSERQCKDAINIATSRRCAQTSDDSISGLQIYATSSELWAINKIQNEFITIANFGYIPISCNGWLHSCKITLI